MRNKKGPLYNLIDSTTPDIIIATETWLDNRVADSEFFNSQFTVHRRDRGTSAHGGVIVAVNSDYISSREEYLKYDNIEAGLRSTSPGVNHSSLVDITGPSLVILLHYL